jgi:hypothetical protein
MEVLARLEPQISAIKPRPASISSIAKFTSEIQQLPSRISHYDKADRVDESREVSIPGSQGLRQLQDQLSHALLILFRGITVIILLITLRKSGQSFSPETRRGAEIAMRLARRNPPPAGPAMAHGKPAFALLGGGFGILVALWTQSALLSIFFRASERMNPRSHYARSNRLWFLRSSRRWRPRFCLGSFPRCKRRAARWRRSRVMSGSRKSDMSPRRFEAHSSPSPDRALAAAPAVGAGLFPP